MKSWSERLQTVISAWRTTFRASHRWSQRKVRQVEFDSKITFSKWVQKWPVNDEIRIKIVWIRRANAQKVEKELIRQLKNLCTFCVWSQFHAGLEWNLFWEILKLVGEYLWKMERGNSVAPDKLPKNKSQFWNFGEKTGCHDTIARLLNIKKSVGKKPNNFH